MLEVVSAPGRQCGIERSRPFHVSFGQSPQLVGGKSEVADCSLEWFASVDRIQGLPPHLTGEPRLRPASEPWLRRSALSHRSQSQPSSQRVRVPCRT
jgi:hypothetical protein